MGFITLKNSVRCPKSAIIIAAAHNARELLGLSGPTYVTSMNDSVHMRGSKHYTDNAVDFRTRDLTAADVQRWAAYIRTRLGKGYDVLIEKDHLHIEYDDA